MIIEITPRELATILAALRTWQDHQRSEWIEPSREFMAEYFHDDEPLDEDEIDKLCIVLNTGGR